MKRTNPSEQYKTCVQRNILFSNVRDIIEDKLSVLCTLKMLNTSSKMSNYTQFLKL